MPTHDPRDDETLKRQLSQYALSEDRGVSLLSQMLTFVPTEEERIFIESQLQDEIKHNRLFADRAEELGAEETFFHQSLERLYEFGQACVDKKDWLQCVACQSVIEELAIASFSVFFQRADEKTRTILLEVIDDEKRHLDFAFNQIQKWAKTDEDYKKVFELQEKVLMIFLNALEPTALSTQFTPDEQKNFKQVLKNTYKLHTQRFSRLKMPMPEIPARYLVSLL